MMDYETDNVTEFCQAGGGGNLAMIGLKWGTSLGQVQDDKFGLAGASAGVRTQLILNTTDGSINIMGAYWPNKHSAGDTSDQNLRQCLSRYVLRHRLKDDTPIQLMQCITAVRTQTAIKNGAKGTIICGDLNATWTGNEAGGQTVLERWAGDFRFTNGLRQLADKQHLHVYT